MGVLESGWVGSCCCAPTAFKCRLELAEEILGPLRLRGVRIARPRGGAAWTEPLAPEEKRP